MVKKWAVFLVVGVFIFSVRVWACPDSVRKCKRGEHGRCDGDTYYADTGKNTSCPNSRSCNCATCCGEYGCSSCNCQCCTCDPPDCPQSDQSIDNDKDGYTDQCTDCDPNNPRVNPGSSEGFCDCNSDTPGSVSALGLSKDYHVTAGIPETTGCECKKKTSSGKCLKFTPGCLCYDGHDNDCDGLTDLKDPDCPNIDEDWVIATDFTLTEDKDISPNGLYVLAGKTFTVASGVTLTVGKVGVHLFKGAHIKLEKGAHIKMKK